MQKLFGLIPLERLCLASLFLPSGCCSVSPAEQFVPTKVSLNHNTRLSPMGTWRKCPPAAVWLCQVWRAGLVCPLCTTSPITNEIRRISGSCCQFCSRVGPALRVWDWKGSRRSHIRHKLHIFVWILVEIWIIFQVSMPTHVRHVLPHGPTCISMCYLNKDLRA